MKKLWILFLFLQFISVKAQIVFNGSTTGSGSGVSSLTYAKTIAAGNDRIIYVGVTAQDKAISGVKWNGLALTQFTVGTRNGMRVAMYYKALGSSASPTTANVVVTLAGGTDCFSGAGDYSGVWQATPFTDPKVSQAKSLYPSVTFTSYVGHKSVTLMGAIAASPVANGPAQTQYWTFSASHSNRSTEKNGAATITMSHTLSASEDWVMIGGTMVDNSVALPIELLSFNAERVNKEVDLFWSTAMEINNDYFSLERSADAINFECLGHVDGAGNSQAQLNYTYIDENPLTGVSYYRLKQTDFNGNYKYSNIVAVNIKEVEIINIYPNPANTDSKVIINSPEDQQVDFVIISSDGKLVREKSALLNKGVNSIQMDINELAEGHYTFSVRNFDRVFSQKQFIVK